MAASMRIQELLSGGMEGADRYKGQVRSGRRLRFLQQGASWENRKRSKFRRRPFFGLDMSSRQLDTQILGSHDRSGLWMKAVSCWCMNGSGRAQAAPLCVVAALVSVDRALRRGTGRRGAPLPPL